VLGASALAGGGLFLAADASGAAGAAHESAGETHQAAAALPSRAAGRRIMATLRLRAAGNTALRAADSAR